MSERVAAPSEQAWRALLAHRRARRDGVLAPSVLPDGPYRAIAVAAGPLVIAQLGQSLDGRIATETGHSHYINGPAALDHLHRLRALADAVVVGAGTVCADDPALTVRRCLGPHPARVVLDARGALPADRRVFAGEGGATLVVTSAAAGPADLPGHVTVERLAPSADGRPDPAAVLAALSARGLDVVLVEGGARTVSAFLAAGCVDRLQVAVAPLIIGSGVAGLTLPPIARLDGAIRPPCAVWDLDGDVLFDCDLASARA